MFFIYLLFLTHPHSLNYISIFIVSLYLFDLIFGVSISLFTIASEAFKLCNNKWKIRSKKENRIINHQLLIQFIIKSLLALPVSPYLSLVLVDFHLSLLGSSCFYPSLFNSLTCEIYLSLSLFLPGSPWLSLDFPGSSSLFLSFFNSTCIHLSLSALYSFSVHLCLSLFLLSFQFLFFLSSILFFLLRTPTHIRDATISPQL